MKIVSVMTTEAAGGAEFAAVEMLDALAARGHDVVMLSDQPEIGRQTRVLVHPIEIGPKLSTRSWVGLMGRWFAYVRRLRQALEREQPYDVLLVHYKKEQLMAALLPARLRATLVWAEWGPVPYPLRRGIPRQAYLAAARRARLIMAVSEGTKRSVADVGVPAEKIIYVPNVVDVESIRYTEAGRASVRERLVDSRRTHSSSVASHGFIRRSATTSSSTRSTRLEDPRAHLVLAGAGETEAALRAQAESLGGRAHFVPTPQDDVADVLSAFDVSVFCPSPTEGAPRATILGHARGASVHRDRSGGRGRSHPPGVRRDRLTDRRSGGPDGRAAPLPR